MPHIKNALIRYRIIDRCIRNKYKKFPTKQDLREACEESLYGSSDGANICDSTIEKDMFAMKMEHDAPIKYSKIHKGYYYSDPEFSINDIPLTEDDLSSIKFAVSTLMQFREVDMFKQFGNAIDKIVDRVSIASNPNDQDINHFIQFESAVSIGGSEYLPLLLEAIRDSKCALFNYASFVSDKPKLRTVVPLLLKEYRNRWYLISFDNDKSAIITYALDRITDLEISSEDARKPPGFNADNYFRYSVGISANNNDLPVIVKIKANKVAAKYIDSQPIHHSQVKVKSSSLSTIFELEVLLSEELIRTILSFSGEVTVLKPKALKNTLIDRIKKMQENYKIP
jgi:predicted DNA-binding transcriptional regulator YafY